MLIKLRDNNNKLVIKDCLDIDFDMSVTTRNGKYKVQINRLYFLDGEFDSEEDAEDSMTNIANARNKLENELREY